MTDQTATRQALIAASKSILSGRTRVGACDWLNSHRDGPCARCVARDLHDAKLAAQAVTG